MPNRFVIRDYDPTKTYHLTHRALPHISLFPTKLDYSVFTSILERYHNTESLTVIAYSLSPDHFHLVLHPYTTAAIPHYLRQLTAAYHRHLRTQHNHVGPLFWGKFKSAPITTTVDLLHLSRYLHTHGEITSYQAYLNEPSPWLDTATILELMPKEFTYQQFVESGLENPLPMSLTLD